MTGQKTLQPLMLAIKSLTHICHMTSRHNSQAGASHMVSPNSERVVKCILPCAPRERRTDKGEQYALEDSTFETFDYGSLIITPGSSDESIFFFSKIILQFKLFFFAMSLDFPTLVS